jgi:hypothetical protein
VSTGTLVSGAVPVSGGDPVSTGELVSSGRLVSPGVVLSPAFASVATGASPAAASMFMGTIWIGVRSFEQILVPSFCGTQASPSWQSVV